MRKKKISLSKVIKAELNAVKEKSKTEDKWTIINKKKEALHHLYENEILMQGISSDELLKMHKQLVAEDDSLKEYMVGITSGVIAGLLTSVAVDFNHLPWYVISLGLIVSAPLLVFVTLWVFKTFTSIFDSYEAVYINKYHAKLIKATLEKRCQFQAGNDDKTE